MMARGNRAAGGFNGHVVTGRAAFVTRLASHCPDRGHPAAERLAILCIDLDRFKHINAAFGHAFGDAVLRAVAERLRDSIPDAIVLAHLAGDEFALAVTVRDADAALTLAHEVRRLLSAPLALGNGPIVSISGSVGVAVCPDHGVDPSLLLNRADIAVYRGKDGGEDSCQLYQAAMEEAPRERQRLLVALHEAIEQQQFTVVFQPKISLIDQRYAGAEILVRWISPALGEVAPELFVPIAEDAGLIQGIGDWVMFETGQALRRWRDAGVPAGRLAMNVSAAQIRRDDFVERIAALLVSVGDGGPRLEIEITESALMANLELAAQRLIAVKALGASITLDDFGTGYSTFSHLKRLPIDALKISADFIADIIGDPAAARLAAAMIAMSRALGLRVVAEGIETEAQARFLTRHGCDIGQGFLFARPMPAAEFESWLAGQPR